VEQYVPVIWMVVAVLITFGLFQIRLFRQFFHNLFWVDRLKNVDNYEERRKTFFYYSFVFNSQSSMYLYVYIGIMLSMNFWFNFVPWYLYVLILFVWPLLYRLTMGWQIWYQNIEDK